MIGRYAQLLAGESGMLSQPKLVTKAHTIGDKYMEVIREKVKRPPMYNFDGSL